jgi:prepilin-type processing-associated H-X9-DG protein
MHIRFLTKPATDPTVCSSTRNPLSWRCGYSLQINCTGQIMSQDNQFGQQPYPMQQYPSPPRGSGSSTGVTVAIIAAVVAIPMVLLCIGILVGLLLPAVQAAREAARRMQCSNNMKQIALAFHNYHDAYGTLPPAFTTDANGKPLHSWRTLILPFIEQNAIHQQIDFSKPWDDPVNLPFSQVVIPTYACPSGHTDSPEKTCYQVVVDPSGIFPGANKATKFSEVSDGLSNTILAIETESENAVPWMAPVDADMSTYLSLGQSIRPNHTGGSNAAFGDGSIQFMSNSVDANAAKAMVTKDAGDAPRGY